MRARIGGFFGGHRATVGPSLSLRTGDTFSASVLWSWNDVDVPAGHFVANLTGVRLAYNVSPRQFLQAFVQYNDSADLWSANARYGLLGQASTGLFIVYNDPRGLNDTVLPRRGRSLIIKFSRMFELLD